MMKKTIAFAALLNCFLITSFPCLVTAQEALVLKMGAQFGWKDFTQLSHIGFQKNKEGFFDMTLAPGNYQVSDKTDLLLHFDQGQSVDETGRYLVASSEQVIRRDFSFMGDGSAVFREQTPLVLQATNQKALFYPGRVWQDFTCEFWLYPAQVQDGEVILLWKGIRDFSHSLEDQLVQAAFVGSKLVWTFQNLFAPELSQKALTITVQGDTPLLPRKWRHHLLRFQAKTGLLEYLLDGQTEALTYVTSSKQESGKVHQAVIGRKTSGDFLLGPRYTGAIDELRLSQDFIETPHLERYFPSSELNLNQQTASKGTAITRIFDLKQPGTQLKTIVTRHSLEKDAQIRYYYRLSETIGYQWTKDGVQKSLASNNHSEEESWIAFQPGQILPTANSSRSSAGRYLQLKVDFFPSGTGNESVRLSQIEVHHFPYPPPPTPTGLEVISGDRQLSLQWKPVVQDQVDGYMVLWGVKPGYYTEVRDVGKTTSFILNPVVNDQLYYVCLVSYQNIRQSGQTIMKKNSIYSREVSARPQKDPP